MGAASGKGELLPDVLLNFPQCPGTQGGVCGNPRGCPDQADQVMGIKADKQTGAGQVPAGNLPACALAAPPGCHLPAPTLINGGEAGAP